MAHIAAQLQATQTDIEDRLMRRMADFESQLQATPASSDVARLASEFHSFRDIVWEIVRHLRRQIAECLQAVDTMEMRHRRKCILISGIPESAEDVSSVVEGIIRDKLQLPEAASHMEQCHRLGEKVSSRPRSVLIRFNSLNDKSAIWRKKTLLKGTSYSMSEFLTKSRQTVFIAARSHYGMRSCWSQDGVITIKLPDGSRRKITTKNELDELIKVSPSAVVAAQPTVGPSRQANNVITPVQKPSSVSQASRKPETRRQAAKGK